MKKFIKGMFHFHSNKHLLGFVLLQIVVYVGVAHGAQYFFNIPLPQTLGLKWMVYSLVAVLFTGIIDRAMIITSTPKG